MAWWEKFGNCPDRLKLPLVTVRARTVVDQTGKVLVPVNICMGWDWGRPDWVRLQHLLSSTRMRVSQAVVPTSDSQDGCVPVRRDEVS